MSEDKKLLIESLKLFEETLEDSLPFGWKAHLEIEKEYKRLMESGQNLPMG